MRTRRQSKDSVFASTVTAHAAAVLRGRMLVIDPASGGTSHAGYAVYRAGKLEEYGVVQVTKGAKIQARLRELYDTLAADETPDILVIERIRGARAHEYLRWSVGVAVAAVNAPVTLEVPVSVWKKYVKTLANYAGKADDEDARYMGEAVVQLARKAAGT